MNRILLLSVLMATAVNPLYSQMDSLQKQINDHVWKPFIESFNTMDTKRFMELHSVELSRVIQDGNKIYGYEEYYRENEEGNKRTVQAKRKRSIELRFVQRIVAQDKAFEIGYYKSTSLQPDGTSRIGYGKFHVLLRKENGTWKILMDADAYERTNETIFQSGKPIE